MYCILCGVNRSPYGFTNTFLVHDPSFMLCLKDLQIVLKLTCTFAKLASEFFLILSSKSTVFQLSVLHTIDRVPATLPDSQKRSQIAFSLGYTRYTPYGINFVSGLPPASIICDTTKDRRSQLIAFQFHAHSICCVCS